MTPQENKLEGIPAQTATPDELSCPSPLPAADTPADVMRALHGLIQDKGLFARCPQEDYWYSVFDGLVAELAPELANDDETRPA